MMIKKTERRVKLFARYIFLNETHDQFMNFSTDKLLFNFGTRIINMCNFTNIF